MITGLEPARPPTPPGEPGPGHDPGGPGAPRPFGWLSLQRLGLARAPCTPGGLQATQHPWRAGGIDPNVGPAHEHAYKQPGAFEFAFEAPSANAKFNPGGRRTS